MAAVRKTESRVRRRVASPEASSRRQRREVEKSDQQPGEHDAFTLTTPAQSTALAMPARAPGGVWYCANPFERGCTHTEDLGLKSMGSYKSQEACQAACALPSDVHRIVAQYDPRAYAFDEKRYGAHRRLSARRHVASMTLRQFVRELDEDSVALRYLAETSVENELPAKQSQEMVSAVRSGRGYLAAEALLRLMVVHPHLAAILWRPMHESPIWRQWINAIIDNSPQLGEELVRAAIRAVKDLPTREAEASGPSLDVAADIMARLSARDIILPRLFDPIWKDGLPSVGVVLALAKRFGCAIFDALIAREGGPAIRRYLRLVNARTYGAFEQEEAALFQEAVREQVHNHLQELLAVAAEFKCPMSRQVVNIANRTLTQFGDYTGELSEAVIAEQQKIEEEHDHERHQNEPLPIYGDVAPAVAPVAFPSLLG